MSEKTATRTKIIKPAEQFEGFGATISFGAHIFTVTVPSAANGEVTITEDYGLKGGENGVPLKETRVVLPRLLWSAISEAARKDFAARLKGQNLGSSRWYVGVNKVDRMLGKELCVLAWAAEHAESPEESKAIAAKWSALKPQERWWLFSQTVAETGLPDDKNVGWRKALYFALGRGKPMTERRKSVRPSEDVSNNLSLF